MRRVLLGTSQRASLSASHGCEEERCSAVEMSGTLKMRISHSSSGRGLKNGRLSCAPAGPDLRPVRTLVALFSSAGFTQSIHKFRPPCHTSRACVVFVTSAAHAFPSIRCFLDPSHFTHQPAYTAVHKYVVARAKQNRSENSPGASHRILLFLSRFSCSLMYAHLRVVFLAWRGTCVHHKPSCVHHVLSAKMAVFWPETHIPRLDESIGDMTCQ